MPRWLSLAGIVLSIGVFSSFAQAQVPIDDEFASRTAHLNGLAAATDLPSLPISLPSGPLTFELESGVSKLHPQLQVHRLSANRTRSSTELRFVTIGASTIPVAIPVRGRTATMSFDGRESLRAASQLFRSSPALFGAEFRHGKALVGGRFEEWHGRWVMARLQFRGAKGEARDHVYLLDRCCSAVPPWRIR